MARNCAFTTRPAPFSDRDDIQLKDSHVSGAVPFLNPTRARFEKITTSTDDTKLTPPPGTQFQWRSRDNRKGRHTLLVPATPAAHLPQPTSTKRSVLKGILRMFTTFPWYDVSFLVAFFFSVGCAIFIACGLFYWLPQAYPATAFPNEASTAGGVTAFVGGTLFEIGAVLLMFEATNENQTGCFGWELEHVFSHKHNHKNHDDDNDDDVEKKQHHPPPPSSTESGIPADSTTTPSRTAPTPRPSTQTCAHHHTRRHGFLKSPPSAKPTSSQRTWHWLPTLHELRTHYIHDLGFLGSFAEFLGATIFYINCILALPGVYSHLSQGVLWGLYWLTYLVGGVLFIISSELYLLETQRNWYTPAPHLLGWWVGLWNMIGSVGWTLAAALGYCDLSACEYQSDLTLIWASVAFLIGSLILWYEALDKYPVEREGHGS